MSDELEPLGPLALRALAAEQKRGAVDSALQERLLARVVASVAVGAAATVAASTAAAATGTAAGAGTTAGAAATGLTVKALPWIIAAFVVGGGAGAAIHAAVAPSPSSSLHPSLEGSAPEPVRSALVAPPSPTASETLPSTPVGSLPSAAATVIAPRPSVSAAPAMSASSGGSDVDLASERALVDRARTAIRLGQSSDALAALDAHASRYPRGRLSEEREALAVDALARSGRVDEARARAARFKAAYPNSVFGAVVDAAIGAH